MRSWQRLWGGGSRTPSILQSTAQLMGVRVVGFASSFVFSVLLARAAGADGAGAYYLAFSTLTIASLIARFGMDNPVVRMVAAADADDSPEAAAAVYATAFRLCLSLGVGAAVVLVAAAPSLANGLFNDDSVTTPLRVMALGLPVWALTSIVGRALVGMGRVTLGVIVEGGGLSVIHLLLFGAVGRQHGVTGAAASFGLTNVVVLVLGAAAWRRLANVSEGNPAPVDHQLVRAELMAGSLPLFLVSVLGVAGNFVSLTLLGALGTSADVGIYAVSDRVAKTGAVALLSLNTVLAPRFAQLYHRDEIGELRRLLRRSVLVLTCVSLVVTAPMVLFPSLILSIFGDEFADATTALRLLAVVYGINIAAGPVGFVLKMTKNEKRLRNVNFVSTGAHVVVATALIPWFGVLGAATAGIVATVANNSLSWVIIHRRLVPDKRSGL